MAAHHYRERGCLSGKRWLAGLLCLVAAIVAVAYWAWRCLPYSRARVEYRLTVVDSQNGTPLPNVQIEYTNWRSFKGLPNRVEQGTTSTDTEGNCLLRMTHSRYVFVRVSCPGYEEGFAVLPLDRAMFGATRISLQPRAGWGHGLPKAGHDLPPGRGAQPRPAGIVRPFAAVRRGGSRAARAAVEARSRS